HLPLLIEAVEFAGDALTFGGVVAGQQPRPQPGVADPAARIDTRPDDEAEMPGRPWPAKPCNVGKRREAAGAAMAQRDQALGNAGAMEPTEGHHVADRTDGDETEPLQEVRLGAAGRVPARLAEGAVDGDQRQEGDANRGEMTEAGKIVLP